MPQPLPAHTLMVTFLSDALSKRDITAEHLADLLAPIPEGTIESWLAGTTSPSVNDLVPLATALDLQPVELVAGWMIDNYPELEGVIRPLTLDPLGSDFPRGADLALRAPRWSTDMNVGDPHDEQAPSVRPVRKRASRLGLERSTA